MRLLRTFLFLIVFPVCAIAQSNTGSLTGTVADASGVIPNATITITDNRTGRERTTQSSGEGTFSFTLLDVGLYTVKVTATGHKTYTASEVKIDVGAQYSLNPMLEPGAINETVNVVAGAEIINSTTGELSTTVNQRQVVELPLNGRNPLALIQLQAGTSSNGLTSMSINGQRSSFTNITRDGINVQDNFIRANATDFTPDRPNVDDTGEFTIVTQNAGADSGYGASQVQLVTPRGANDFHGAVYEYNRNSKFAGNSFFNNFNGTPLPFLNRNQFGGKIGGRIIKDKFFFFGAYERFMLHQGAITTRTILMPDARNGIFTWVDTAGVTRTANLFTLAAAGGVTGTPPTGINSTIQSRFLANVPTQGNTGDVGDALNTTGYRFAQTSNQDRWAYTSRFDYVIHPNHAVNVVYNYKKEFLQRPDVDNGGFGTTPFGFQDAHTPFLAVAYHGAFSNKLSNEIRGGYQGSDPTFDRTNVPSDYFLTLALIGSPESTFQRQGRNTTIFNLQDNATWTRGDHTFRFGGSYDRFDVQPFGPPAFASSTIPTFAEGGGTTPAFSLTQFNTAAGCVAAAGTNCINTAQLAAANSLLTLLGGTVGSGNLTYNVKNKTSGFQPNTETVRNLVFSHWSGYFSDQWRARPSLSLNLGLRYELFTPVKERDGLALEPVFGTQAPLQAVLNPGGTYDFAGGNSGVPNAYFRTDKNNFAPVLSVAWSPNFGENWFGKIFPNGGRTVIRTGFRQSFVNDEFIRSADNATSGNAGLVQTVIQGGLNARAGSLPSFTAPAFQVPRTYAQNNSLAANFGTVFGIDPNLETPKITEFNVGVERELPHGMAIEARFVHGQSSNLVRGLDFNQVRIFDNGFLTDFNRALNNLNLGLSANCTSGAGCQPLAVLNDPAKFSSSAVALLSNSTITNAIRAGTPGQLAFIYLSNFGVGNATLLANANTGVADYDTNSARYNYNSAQIELRKRFMKGWTFQANYTLQKTLTDAAGTGQTRFDPLIDNANPSLEYARADFDTAQVFNFNTIYELPFGKGRRWLSTNGSLVEHLVGGWQLTSIIRASVGAPILITDTRGTLNRAGRSARQTPQTNLTLPQLKALLGVFKTPCGVFGIDPAVINLDLAKCQQGIRASRVAGLNAGIGAVPFGSAPFPGEVFFVNGPGQTGNMARNFDNGPFFFNWDASIIKNIRITEKTRFQLRAEAFNVLNRANFFYSGNDVSSTSFGRITSTFTSSSAQRVIQFVGRFEF
jgi:hypothetical protein